MANPFDTGAMAAGYARWRPPVHPRVIELARPWLGGVRRALDVGCGAGLSTRALAPVAAEVVGLEPAAGMLAASADLAPGAHFVVAEAEALPFAPASFDLLAAAGSLNWVAPERFYPEALRVLAPHGRLFVYDYSPGRDFADGDALGLWFAEFLRRYPGRPTGARRLDPGLLAAEAAGFHLGPHAEFALPIRLDPDFYLEYLLTGTNVAAHPREEVRAWCAQTLAPLWNGQPRDVVFRGYYACLDRATAIQAGC